MAGERIMIVEDEHVVALDIRRTIEGFGYTTTGIHPSGESCLAGIEEEDPDLVLMDVRLQGDLDGFQTAKICRERFDVPVVMLTAFADESTLERGKTSQPFAYVLKPFDPRELNSAIFMSVYRHRMEKTVSEQRERIRRSEKMEALGRLTGGIAHDFNNLLTVIMGYSRLIREELDGLDEGTVTAISEELEGIEKAARKSASLTKQLLAFSRNQNSSSELLSLNETISRLEPILSKLVHDDVAVSVDLMGEADTIYADRSQIEQVIINLVVNARDAMQDGGRLIIRTGERSVSASDAVGRDGVEPGVFVELSVSDTGSGMGEETISRAFDPFFTTKEEGKGTGLGLSTVYGIVSRGGGFIDVESELGHGTTFRVAFPLRQGEENAADAESRKPGTDTGTETILFVEDDESIRHLVARVLRRKGYSVLDTSNAGEALLEAENHPDGIDILVSDVVMPLMSGIRLAARLRERQPAVRVLLMSGYPESSLTADECETLGVEFVAKPIDPADLAVTIRRILDAS